MPWGSALRHGTAAEAMAIEFVDLPIRNCDLLQFGEFAKGYGHMSVWVGLFFFPAVLFHFVASAADLPTGWTLGIPSGLPKQNWHAFPKVDEVSLIQFGDIYIYIWGGDILSNYGKTWKNGKC